MNKSLNYFSTSDLGLTVVVSLSYPIDSIDKTNPLKSVFYFQRQEGLDALVARYWSRQLRVEPQVLFSQLKSIKSRLYEHE